MPTSGTNQTLRTNIHGQEEAGLNKQGYVTDCDVRQSRITAAGLITIGLQDTVHDTWVLRNKQEVDKRRYIPDRAAVAAKAIDIPYMADTAGAGSHGGRNENDDQSDKTAS